jgi:hypothetical protein
MIAPMDDTLNESPPFVDVNLFMSDRVLQETVAREGAAWAVADLEVFGGVAGSAAAIELGRTANAHPPVLHSLGVEGRRVERVEFHPAYHELMAISSAQGLHCSTWEHLLCGRAPAAGAHVARAAGSYMAVQMEPGHCCPITMTHAAVAALRHAPELSVVWLPKILSRAYEPESVPPETKSAATLGMGMTERQGGTDVRGNTTRATALGGGAYVLNGHKWFLSAPMSDAFLVLAQAEAGLSCFLLPRLLSDGALNGLLHRAPETLRAVLEEIEETGGQDSRLKAALDRIEALLAAAARDQAAARPLVEALVTAQAGALLLAHAPAFVSDAYLSSRLAGNASQTYGAQQGAVDDEEAILDRAGPALG